MHHHWRDHFSSDDTGDSAWRWCEHLYSCGYLSDEAYALAQAEITDIGYVRDRDQVRADKMARRRREAGLTHGLSASPLSGEFIEQMIGANNRAYARGIEL